MNIAAIDKNKFNRLALWLACLAGLALVLLSEYSYHQAVGNVDDVGVALQARTTLRRLERAILVAETGQRGYLMTSRKEYLEQYRQALANIKETLPSLDQYFADVPQEKQLLEKLRALTASKISELELTIRLHDEGKAAAAIDMVLSGIGREQLVETLAVNDELLGYTYVSVAEGRRNVYQTLWISRVGLAMLAALVILAVFKYLRQNATQLQQQLEQHRLVQAERDRLESEVTRRTATLTELTHHLQTAREDERRRIARDLHDELGALLTAAKLDVARVKARLTETAPSAQGLLTHLVDTLNSCVALKRRIIEGLQPSSLTHLGLVATLEILAREFAERTGLKVHCELQPVGLEATAELVIYRAVQESMTNIVKYARAHNVWITLGSRDGNVQLSVRDDGVGFDTETLPIAGHGLTGMRFRFEAEGGTLSVVAAPGKGTLLQATLPESAPAAIPE